MRKSWLLAAGVSAFALLAPAGTARAVDDPVVRILGPAAASTIGGDVTVQATVSGLPADVADAYAYAHIGSYERHGGSVDSPPQPLAAGQCTTSCTLTFTLDTDASQGPQGDWTLADGRAVLVVGLRWNSGTQVVADSFDLSVNNHRPVLAFTDDNPGLAGLQLFDGLTASGPVTPVRFTVTSPPGATAAVTAVKLWVNYQSTVTATLTVPAPASGDVFTANLDTADWPDATRRYIRAVAVDARGVQSVQAEAPISVDRGLEVTTPTMPAVLPNTFNLGPKAIPVHVVSRNPYAVASWTRTWLDGEMVEQRCECNWDWPAVTDVQPSLGMGLLAEGPHTVRFEVRDTRDVGTFTDPIAFTVDGGPAARFTAGAGAVVQVGTPVTLAAALTAPAGQTITGWTMTVGGTPIAASSPCPTDGCPATATATGTWTPTEAGAVHPGNPYGLGGREVVVTVTGSSGAVRTLTSTVAAYGPARVILGAPTRATYGTPYKVLIQTGRTDGAQTPNAAFVLQRRPAGSTTWRTVTSGRTGINGEATVSVRPTGTAAWRVVMPAEAGKHGAATSTTRSTVVVSTTRLVDAPATARRYRVMTARVKTAPYEAGLRVRLQVRRPDGAWRTVTSAPVSTTGTAKLYFKLAGTGTWRVRVVRPATVRAAASKTTSWRVKIYR